MAPVDRREHRQQRVRGAGASTVQASFGFNFGALGAKQASLPPQRSGRRSRTPVQSTPRNSNGSARRHRSLSAPRSVKSQRSATPKNNVVTPRLGKRKRGSSAVAAPENENEEDELSPDRVENVASVEKSRRVAKTVSPIREEPNEAPDELSIIEEAPFTVRKTPTPGNVTGLLSNGTGVSADSRRSGARRSRSTDVVPVTPGMQPSSNARQSFALSTTIENTASNASQAEDEDMDELSPPQNADAITPRVILRKSISNDIPPEGEDGGIDELSPAQATIPNTIASVAANSHNESVATPVPARSVARGRPRKSNGTKENSSAATPAVRKPTQRKSRRIVAEDEPTEEQADELSPETQKTTQVTLMLARRTEEEVEASDEESEAYEEPLEPDDAPRESTPKPIAKRTVSKQVQRAKPASDKPPRKRQKALGPKLSISVMRMKGYGVRGITVADTTRTILEETIDHRLGRMLEKMQTASDSSSRKELRSEVNLALSFKESLNEKLLDLQDANDVLTTNLKKLRVFKRDNAELRKDILALQNSRQEIALEHDDVQAEYEGEKARVESKNTLSDNMFDIETAIQNGRKRARQERREEEGPNVPLSLLLETMSSEKGTASPSGETSKVVRSRKFNKKHPASPVKQQQQSVPTYHLVVRSGSGWLPARQFFDKRHFSIRAKEAKKAHVRSLAKAAALNVLQRRATDSLADFTARVHTAPVNQVSVAAPPSTSHALAAPTRTDLLTRMSNLRARIQSPNGRSVRKSQISETNETAIESLASRKDVVKISPLFHPFPRLPREIQDEIFYQAIGYTGKISIYRANTARNAPSSSEPPITISKLFRISRSINEHVTTHIFRSTNFQFGMTGFTNFLWQIGPINRSHLQNLTFRFGKASLLHCVRWLAPDPIWELFLPPVATNPPSLTYFWRCQIRDLMRELTLLTLTIDIRDVPLADVSLLVRILKSAMGSTQDIRIIDNLGSAKKPNVCNQALYRRFPNFTEPTWRELALRYHADYKHLRWHMRQKLALYDRTVDVRPILDEWMNLNRAFFDA
ncbi:hypothetical protein E8E11_010544 [Didymella keratinophila]|nr:hypothetical protein E8E11_010544 [Didymella keratinophila]